MHFPLSLLSASNLNTGTAVVCQLAARNLHTVGDCVHTYIHTSTLSQVEVHCISLPSGVWSLVQPAGNTNVHMAQFLYQQITTCLGAMFLESVAMLLWLPNDCSVSHCVGILGLSSSILLLIVCVSV